MIDTNLVKQLRDQTGVSIMQCRKALEDAQGDIKKAEVILQRQGRAIAEKKSNRTLGAGAIQSYIHSTGTVGSMVELLCETDFVAKNKEFKDLAYDIAMQITAVNPSFLKREDLDKPADMQEKILQGKLDSYFSDKILLEQPFIKDQGVKIKELIESAIQKFGEKIEIGKFTRFSI
jgi:elongation factor Ts